jgi:hypothetical protein
LSFFVLLAKAEAYCGNLKKLATRDCGTETRLPTVERSFNGIEFGGIDTRERQELSDFGMLSQTSSATLFTRFAIFKEKKKILGITKIKFRNKLCKIERII